MAPQLGQGPVQYLESVPGPSRHVGSQFLHLVGPVTWAILFVGGCYVSPGPMPVLVDALQFRAGTATDRP
jgi:hypothetical protein